MNDEKWGNTISLIEEKFGVEERKTVPDNLEDNYGNVFEGTKETVIFKGPLGKIKLERIAHPLILDKKMHYHKGSGGTAEVEYQVSETEKTHRLIVFKQSPDTLEWEELDLPEGTMTF